MHRNFKLLSIALAFTFPPALCPESNPCVCAVYLFILGLNDHQHSCSSEGVYISSKRIDDAGVHY